MNRNGGRGIGVSIVVSTNRPHFFKNILANYQNQRYANKELVIVLHKDGIRLEKYQKKIRALKHVSVYTLPEKLPLGYCLNYAISKTKYPLIAKFDDDDYYSPYYLSEQSNALYRSGTDVVGKKAYFIYLEASKKLILKNSMLQHKFLKMVAGGTILFRRRLLKRVRFAPHISLGEDVNFLANCRMRGYKIYATSPYNYVYIRRRNRLSHSWKVPDSRLLLRSKLVAITNQYRTIATRKF